MWQYKLLSSIVFWSSVSGNKDHECLAFTHWNFSYIFNWWYYALLWDNYANPLQYCFEVLNNFNHFPVYFWEAAFHQTMIDHHVNKNPVESYHWWYENKKNSGDLGKVKVVEHVATDRTPVFASSHEKSALTFCSTWGQNLDFICHNCIKKCIQNPLHKKKVVYQFWSEISFSALFSDELIDRNVWSNESRVALSLHTKKIFLSLLGRAIWVMQFWSTGDTKSTMNVFDLLYGPNKL